MWAAALGQTTREPGFRRGPTPLFTTCGFVAFEEGIRLSVIHYFRTADVFRARAATPIELGDHSFPVIFRPWLPNPGRGGRQGDSGTCWIEFPATGGDRRRGILTAGHAVQPEHAAMGTEVTLDVARAEPQGWLRLDSPIMDAAVIEVEHDQWRGTAEMPPSSVVGYKPVRLVAGSRSVEADIVEHSGFVGATIPGQFGAEPLTATRLFLNNHLSRGDSGCVGVDLEFERHQRAPITPPYLLYQGKYGAKSYEIGYGLMLEQARIVWGLNFHS